MLSKCLINFDEPNMTL